MSELVMSGSVGYYPLASFEKISSAADGLTSIESRKRPVEEDNYPPGKLHKFKPLSPTNREWASVRHWYDSSHSRLRECSFRILPIIEESMRWYLDKSYHCLSLKLIKKDLKNFKELLTEKDQQLIKKIHGILNNALLLSREFSLIFHNYEKAPERIRRLAEVVRDKLHALEVEEVFLVPGGHCGPDKVVSGHAVLYEIIRTSDERYSFEIFNTGAGSIYIDSTNHLVTSLKFINIHLKNISNICFLQTLISYRVLNSDFKMDDVLKYIKLHLGSSQGAELIAGARYEKQLRQSCSYSSAVAWIGSKLPEIYFETFKSYIRIKALMDLPKLIKENRFIMPQEVASLLEEACRIG